MKSEIVFADSKTKKAFDKLKATTTEDKKLYDSLVEAFKELEKNAFLGIQVQKSLYQKNIRENSESWTTCGNIIFLTGGA